jgi:hypothetical protein
LSLLDVSPCADEHSHLSFLITISKKIQDSFKDCNDDTDKALKIMHEFADMGAQAIIPVGGWPMWNELGWIQFVVSNKEKNLTLVVGDTLESQLRLMNMGYVNGLVGQLPFEMGQDSINVLWSLTKGEHIIEMTYGTAILEVLRIPLVLPGVQVNENYIDGLAIVGYVLFALIAAASLGLMVWTYLHKNTRVIKASQPFFLQMIIVGILVFSSAIVPLTFDDKRFSQEASDIACMTVPWLLTIGFTTTVSEFQIHPYPPLPRCICKQNHLCFRLRPSSLPSSPKHGG